MNTATFPSEEMIASKIYRIRDQKVMMDADLALLYGVSTKRLNEQVRRNLNRFPEDFMFQLSENELDALRSQIATTNPKRGGRRYAPYVFTEHGAVMLAAILRSETAVAASIYVVRAFVKMRQLFSQYQDLATVVERLKSATEQQFQSQGKQIKVLFETLEEVLRKEDDPGRIPVGFQLKEKA